MELPIRLDHFLKRRGVAQTGGHAKLLIIDGLVSVNGEVDTRRRRKLQEGDVVTVDGQTYQVKSNA